MNIAQQKAVLVASELWKSFAGEGQGAATEVLRGVDVQILEGESVAIVGPSGSGKSTLLHLFGGLTEPTRGSVCFQGRELSGLSTQELAHLRNRSIGYVFQNHHLLPQCSALENVLIPTLVSSADRGALQKRAESLLEQVGLGHRLQHRPGQLSGGECQRVAVARALINSPCIVLADEPTGALDAESAANLGELLLDLHEKEKLTLVVVTHSLDLAGRMQRLLELRNGQLVAPSSVS